MKHTDSTPGEWKAANKLNTKRLAIWTFAWVASVAIAAFAPKYLWHFDSLLTMVALLVNVAVGVVMVLSNRAYLRGLDEMQQKIMSDAMAATLGVGLVAGVSYEMMEDIKLISFEPEISHLMMLMGVTYMIALIRGQRRYQ